MPIRRIRRARLTRALPLVAVATVSCAPHGTSITRERTRSAAPSIETARLAARLAAYAHDSMLGREAGSRAHFTATTYIAEEARTLGLQPMGESGYFQTVPIMLRSVDTTSSVNVNGDALAYGRDYIVSTTGGRRSGTFEIVYGGRLGSADANALTEAQVRGKLVVFDLTEAGTVAPLPNATTAAAMVAAPGLERLLQTNPNVARSRAYALYSSDTTRSVTLIVTRAARDRLLGAADGAIPAVGATGRSVAVRIGTTWTPTVAPSRNVIAMLPGSDPALRGQYVAIGAHSDHIGLRAQPVDHDSLRIFYRIVRPGGIEDNAKLATAEQQQRVNTELAAWRAAHPGASRADSVNNGADDDGSGSMAVLEIARRLTTQRPKRSILFVWHVGEEKGLLGSAHYTDHPTVPRDSIVAQLNVDMIGRGKPDDQPGIDKSGAPLRGRDDYLQLVGSRRLSTELGDLVEAVNAAQPQPFRFDYAIDAAGHPWNIYCRSDHYMYARYGIPITFFTTGGHSDYHQVTDEPQYIDYAHYARVATLIADVALRVANLDHRVVVDQPKPASPTAPCRQ